MNRPSLTRSRAVLSLLALPLTLFSLLGVSARAQEPTPAGATPSAISLTLKRAIELALQNSKDIQVAKLQASLADRAAMITKAPFLPNVFAGSGAGYTFGIPETPGGRAPAVLARRRTGSITSARPVTGASPRLPPPR